MVAVFTVMKAKCSSVMFFLDNSSTAIKCQHSATKVNLLVRCLYCLLFCEIFDLLSLSLKLVGTLDIVFLFILMK